jgi:hypothetical protein
VGTRRGKKHDRLRWLGEKGHWEFFNLKISQNNILLEHTNDNNAAGKFANMEDILSSRNLDNPLGVYYSKMLSEVLLKDTNLKLRLKQNI